MEENSKDIQRLIKIKRQRPSFSRMISWEMSQAENTEVTTKVKQKKRQKSRTDSTQSCAEDDCKETEDADRQCDSAGSSDYETANEEVDDDLDHSDAFMSIDSLSLANLDDNDINDDSDEYDIEDEDDNESALVEAAKGALNPARRRRPSKRQKRNRRKVFLMTYSNDLSTLGSLFDMTSEIDDAVQEADDALVNVEVQCPVPSLVELCLQSMKKGRKRQKSGPAKSPSLVPYKIKRIISNWNFQQSMFEKQLSFLHNFVLPSICKNDGVKHDIIYYDDNTKPYVIRHPLRSVWASYALPVTEAGKESYPSQNASAFLYHPSMRNTDTETELDYRDCRYLDRTTPSSIHVQSALATTIDMMLPNTMGDRNLPKGVATETEVMSIAIKTMIIRVKTALKNRYPGLVEHLFDRVMPYVMWARGNIGLATSMFKSLLQKENNYQYKAMYLSEIAVMHQMFSESQTAESFYKLAVEMTLTEETKDQVIKEVTEQKQVLLASVYDCGTLDLERSQHAVRYWTSAVHLPKPNPATVMAAMDSFLGLHLAHITEVDNWREAETRIGSWLSSNKYLHYYLALVRALQGNADTSLAAFREFKGYCGMFLPGHDILEHLEKKDRRNPLSPLINIVTGQKHYVKPMTVVWRTQFRPPRLTKDCPVEADMTSPELNLCINEDGLLTGDMQMLMPPIRQVNLDLLTGAIVFNTIPSGTGTWQTILGYINHHTMVDLMLPTPQQLYSDDDGTTVHLISPNLDPCHVSAHEMGAFLPTCPKILTWRNSAGQTSRLNLITITKNICKQKLDETDLTKYPYNSYAPRKLVLFKHLMDVVCTKNLTTVISEIQSSATRIWNKPTNYRKKKEISKKGRGSTNQEAFDPAKLYSPKDLPNLMKHYCVDVTVKPFQFGQCLVVYLRLHLTEKLFYMMFIDTSSKEGFQNYKMESTGTEHPNVPNQARVGTTMTDAKYFMYLKNRHFLHIHNDKGENVDTLELKEERQTDGSFKLCIIGGYLFGINRSQLNLWRHVIGSEFDPTDLNNAKCLSQYWELPDARKVIDEFEVLGTEVKGKGQFLMLHMSMGLGFMDPDTMEMIPITIQSNCPRELTEDGKVLLEQVNCVKVLTQKSFTDEERAVTLFVVTFTNKILLFKMSHKVGSQEMQATLMAYIILPGKAVEACFVGKNMGLLLSLTQHDTKDKHYREHVFYFACDGTLLQVLLCLSQGPHSFCPVYMQGPENAAEKSGWYVYMRDGRDGIICAQLTSASR